MKKQPNLRNSKFFQPQPITVALLKQVLSVVRFVRFQLSCEYGVFDCQPLLWFGSVLTCIRKHARYTGRQFGSMFECENPQQLLRAKSILVLAVKAFGEVRRMIVVEATEGLSEKKGGRSL